MSKSEIICARFKTDVYAKIENLAEENNMSKGDYIKKLVHEDIRRREYKYTNYHRHPELSLERDLAIAIATINYSAHRLDDRATERIGDDSEDILKKIVEFYRKTGFKKI